MMNARVIFTKEFLDKTKGNNDMKNSYKQCKLHFNKLIDLDNSGELSKATSRAKLAQMVGFTNSRKGYTWVSNAVRRGRISETIIGKENGKNIYEYHYNNRQKIEKYRQEVEKYIATGNTAVKLPEPIGNAAVTIKYGDTTIIFNETTSLQVIAHFVKYLNKE